MSAAGSSIFTDSGGYQASLQDMLDLLVVCPRRFNARLTWVELPHVQLMRAEESSARIAYLRLPPEQVFVFFVTHSGPPLVHGGKEVCFGDLVWHSQGGRGHQRTMEASRWGSLAVTAESLLSFGQSIADQALSAPAYPQILRPAAAHKKELLRVHAQASRIAETSPNRIVNPEVVRALDQELIELLINCLETAIGSDDDQSAERQARLCVQFEETLQVEPFRLLPTKEICQVLRVSEQSLRASCRRVLGMGPGRYQRLRRLKLVRFELTRTDMQRPNVPEIMARYGFADLHRFVTEYWQAYGEMPPVPAREAQRQ
jgi:AraC-like DNA-binding protein